LGDAFVDLWIAQGPGIEGRAVSARAVEQFPAASVGNAIGILQEQDRVFSATELDSLMNAWQKSIPPQAGNKAGWSIRSFEMSTTNAGKFSFALPNP
jgi:hypothetical protein